MDEAREELDIDQPVVIQETDAVEGDEAQDEVIVLEENEDGGGALEENEDEGGALEEKRKEDSKEEEEEEDEEDFDWDGFCNICKCHFDDLTDHQVSKHWKCKFTCPKCCRRFDTKMKRDRHREKKICLPNKKARRG